MLRFSNWTCFKQTAPQHTYAISQHSSPWQTKYEVYAAFKSHVYSHYLVTIYAIKISKRFNISAVPHIQPTIHIQKY
jgi:predicted metalloprotease with PDZ domain